MEDINWAARKIGLGMRPGEAEGATVDEWVEGQLTGSFPRLCIDQVKAMRPAIGEWPAELSYTLDERVERMIVRRENEVALERMGLSDGDLNRRMSDNRKATDHAEADTYRFANAAVYGEDQIKQRLGWFWLNHFTVGGEQDTTPDLIGDYWESAIYGMLDGSFADLAFRAITHPGMLTYLDNIHNVGERSQKARECGPNDCIAGINDNLGRELLELHTVSPDRGYTESDIRGAAEILAGWGNVFNLPPARQFESYVEPWWPPYAEPGEKTVLGRTYPAGKGALRMLINDLAQDPYTPRFISAKLARHFIGEAATAADVAAIVETWESSGGDLPSIHRTVLSRALTSDVRRFHWPQVWLYQLLRISGANLIRGYADLGADLREPALREPDWMMAELGDSFWARRQPNGYSDLKADWVSTEHLDRRFRFATLVYRAGRLQFSAEELIERHGLSEATLRLVEQGETPEQKFILFACSPEFMEV